jgi:Ras-related protein Rab-7A
MGKTKKRVLLKVILLGNSGVGKSSLLKRYVENKFTFSYRATVGSDFMSKEIIIDDYIIKLQLWDTAGQEVIILLVAWLH